MKEIIECAIFGGLFSLVMAMRAAAKERDGR
jgi:hypothetical protein